MKHSLSRFRIALAVTMAALAIGLFPTTSYAGTADYWPPYPAPYPGYGSSYGCVHGVRFGETLSGIASRYGTSAHYLMQINGIRNPNLIYAGSSLRVPCSSVYPKPYRYPMAYPMPYPMPYSNPMPHPMPYTNSMPYSMLYPTPSYGTPVPVPPPAATPTPVMDGALTVVIRNSSFNSSLLTIRVGQTVVWRNDDGVPHTTTSGSCMGSVCTPSAGWDSGTLNPGQSFSHAFTTTGSFPYYCTIHGAMMQGTIVVMP